MRRLLAALALALAVAAPAAFAKGDSYVAVVGPKRPAFEPPLVMRMIEGLTLRLVAPPREPYVLVYPLMRGGVPARPGRWYPRSSTYCSGWRSGVEAGCTRSAALRGYLGRGVATGLYTAEPLRILSLRRDGTALVPYGNEATALLLALHRAGRRADPRPPDCVPFRVRWSAPNRPSLLCVSPLGAVYAGRNAYPLPPATAAFLSGR